MPLSRLDFCISSRYQGVRDSRSLRTALAYGCFLLITRICAQTMSWETRGRHGLPPHAPLSASEALSRAGSPGKGKGGGKGSSATISIVLSPTHQSFLIDSNQDRSLLSSLHLIDEEMKAQHLTRAGVKHSVNTSRSQDSPSAQRESKSLIVPTRTGRVTGGRGPAWDTLNFQRRH